MRLRILKSFKSKLDRQVGYIAKDKPEAARRFKTELLLRLKKIPNMPFACRKSIFFDKDEVRDLVFKGYIIVYQIDTEKDIITVFGFTKYEDDPFD